MAQKPESFNKRVTNVLNTPCWKLIVTNYGEKKSSFDFYTRSEKYAGVKKDIIQKISPEATIVIVPGVVTFN